MHLMYWAWPPQVMHERSSGLLPLQSFLAAWAAWITTWLLWAACGHWRSLWAMDLSTCISPSKSRTPGAACGSPGMGRMAQRSRDGAGRGLRSLHSRRPVAQLALLPHPPKPGLPRKMLPPHPFVGPLPRGVQQRSSTQAAWLREVYLSSVTFWQGLLSAESLPIPASAPHHLGTSRAHPTWSCLINF